MRAELHEPLPGELHDRWKKFCNWPDRVYFPSYLGLVVEDIRTDYARLRLPYRPEHEQPAGVIHGGALATLIDTVVVPAIGTGYDPATQFVTVSMTINYLGAAVKTDVVAEGWVTRRGRTMAFCQVEATAGDKRIAEASIVYAVRQSAT